MGKSSLWKTKTEAYHGSKWGFVVLAVVIGIVLALLGAVFYLVGEGADQEIDPSLVVLWALVIAVLAVVFIILAWFFSAVFSFFAQLWSVIWALVTNVYVLIFVIIILGVLLLSASMLGGAADVSLSNPLVIAILVLLLIMFIPFAIFIIDIFSYEYD